MSNNRLDLEFRNLRTDITRNSKMATSSEFIAATGGSQAGPFKVPADLRHLLVTAVLTCKPGPVVGNFLATNENRIVSDRTVAGWLQATRKWLGIPPATRGKISGQYLNELERWQQANGFPTPDEIDAGWVPIHRRGTQQPDDDRSKSKSPEADSHSSRSPNSQVVDSMPDVKSAGIPLLPAAASHKMSPKTAEEFSEFRKMLAQLDEATDDEVAQLLAGMLAKLRNKRK